MLEEFGKYFEKKKRFKQGVNKNLSLVANLLDLLSPIYIYSYGNVFALFLSSFNNCVLLIGAGITTTVLLAEGWGHQKVGVVRLTLNSNQWVRFQFRNFGENQVPFRNHYFQVHFDLVCSICLCSIYEPNRSVWKLLV